MAGLKKNKDLDLRRYGKNLYTKALQSGGNGGSEGGGGTTDSEGDEGTIDYEDIYQFYKQQVSGMLPPGFLETETFIAPEHLEDVINLEGIEYENGTAGIWSTGFPNPVAFGASILFTISSDESVTYIVLGEYQNNNDIPTVG